MHYLAVLFILIAYTGLFIAVAVINYQATAAKVEDPVIMEQRLHRLRGGCEFSPTGRAKNGEDLCMWCSICEAYVNI